MFSHLSRPAQPYNAYFIAIQPKAVVIFLFLLLDLTNQGMLPVDVIALERMLGAIVLVLVGEVCCAQRIEEVQGPVRYLVMVDGSASVSENPGKIAAAYKSANVLTQAIFDRHSFHINLEMPQFNASRGDRIDVYSYGLQKRWGSHWTVQTLGSPEWIFPQDYVHLQERFTRKVSAKRVLQAIIAASQKKFDLNLRCWVTSMGLWGARAKPSDRFSRTYLLWMHDGALNGPGLVNEREMTLQYLGRNMAALETAERNTKNLVLKSLRGNEPILRMQFPENSGLVQGVSLVYELVATDLGKEVGDLRLAAPFDELSMVVNRGELIVGLGIKLRRGLQIDIRLITGSRNAETIQTKKIKVGSTGNSVRFFLPANTQDPVRLEAVLYANATDPILGTRTVCVIHELRATLPLSLREKQWWLAWIPVGIVLLLALIAYLLGYVLVLKNGAYYAVRGAGDFPVALPFPQRPEVDVKMFCREPSVYINLPGYWVRNLYLRDAALEVLDGGKIKDSKEQPIVGSRVLLKSLRTSGLILEWNEGGLGSAILVPGYRKGTVSWRLLVEARMLR